MARNAKSPISPEVAQQAAMSYLSAIGAGAGRWLKFKPDRPIRRRGKRRNGQHRGHVNSRTSRTGKHSK